MKRILVILAFLATSVLSANAQSLPDDAQDFVDRFKTATLTHDYDAVMEFMDREYVKDQYKKLLKKDQEQFIDEFFSGNGNPDGSGFYTKARLVDISSIKLERTALITEGEYQVTFLITQTSSAHYCKVMLRYYKKEWGFFGAVG
jgi:hypothetical protein